VGVGLGGGEDAVGGGLDGVYEGEVYGDLEDCRLA